MHRRSNAVTVTRHAFPIELKSADPAPDAPLGQIEAIVSVFSTADMGKDTILPGAFAKSIANKLPKGVWGHDWSQPVAKTLEARELSPGDPLLPPSLATVGGLYIKAQFNLETQRGKEAYSDVKNGLIDEFSIGYIPLDFERDQKNGGRQLKELGLMEWSPVLVGMHPATAMISIKDGKAGLAATIGDDVNVEDDGDDDDEAHTGVMVAVFLDPLAAGALAIDGGEAVADLHLTLAFLGDTTTLDTLAVARILVATERFARCAQPLTGRVSGYGRFTNGDNDDAQDVFYASVDMPGLEDLQDDLSDALGLMGIQPMREHGFQPHITLKYLAPGGADPPAPDPVPLAFSALTVAVGDQRTAIPMAGDEWSQMWASDGPYGPFGYLGAAPSESKAFKRTLPLGERDAAWDASAADKRVRDWAKATDKPNAKYGRAFAWVDPDAKDKFSGYHLPFADVVGGELTAMPKGIFAAANAIQGGRGADLPDDAKSHAKGVLAPYYTAMATTFKDDAIKPPWDGEKATGGVHETAAISSLLAELRFADHADAVPAAVAGLVERTRSIVGMRRKEGRVFSADRLEKLKGVRDGIRKHADDLDDLIADQGRARTVDVGAGDTTIADEAKAALRREQLRFLQTESRIIALPLR
jgi:HK97 family phage prohead protease